MTGRTSFSETTKKHIRKGATNSSWCWNYQSIHICCDCTSLLLGCSLFNHTLLEKQRLATELATDFDENRLLNALATEMATDENW
jgi:hypothetical protein